MTDYAYNDTSAHPPDPSHRPLFEKQVLKWLERAGPRSVIDVGCGNGDFTEAVSRAGYQTFGVDLSQDAIQVAAARNCGSFALASVYEPLTAAFDVEEFDAAICIEVIEHLYTPLTMLNQIYSALRPGGTLIITTPYWGYLKNCMLAVTDRLDDAFGVHWDGGHIKHFSRKTLTKLAIRAGFEEVAFEGCGTGIRRHTPFLWNSMLMVFRKPACPS